MHSIALALCAVDDQSIEPLSQWLLVGDADELLIRPGLRERFALGERFALADVERD